MAKAEIERDASGAALRLIGAHIDITARRNAEEQRELISRELSHRITNIFTVISSLIKMSARSRSGVADFVDELVGRIGALHRTHALVVRNVADATTDTLASVLDRLVEPYRDNDLDRVSIAGDDLSIGPSAATAIALLIHELATNAVKYGALSSGSGQVRILVQNHTDGTILKWEERGGPLVAAVPTRRGFGSVLVDRAAKSQLGAVLDFDWQPAGVVVTVALDPARLAA